MTFHTLPPNLPEISDESLSDVTPSSASLSAEINPGLGDTIYVFEYGTSSSYGQATVPSGSIGSDEVPHAVSSEISELTPGVIYHFRVVATNFGGTSYGSDQTFNTPGPPAIEATSSSGVTQTGATLEATVRAAFSPTTYHFEYGADSSYGATTPESPSIGADNVWARRQPGDQRSQPGGDLPLPRRREQWSRHDGRPDQTFTTEAAIVPPPRRSPPVKCKRGLRQTAWEVREEEEAAHRSGSRGNG